MHFYTYHASLLCLHIIANFAPIGDTNAQPLRHLTYFQSHQDHMHLHHLREDHQSFLPISNALHVIESDFENIARLPVRLL